MKKAFYFAMSILVLAVIGGCVSAPYEYGAGLEGSDVLKLAPDEPQVERGNPHGFLDWIGHNIVSLPSKIMLLNWSVANHDISTETEEILKQYLADNDLNNVKVHLNDYAPGNEWRRLFRNKSVGGLWRYTLGTISVSFYTILPDRFFAGLTGGDSYNPYTNTIHLYSDHPAIALHEAGHAKDFAGEDDKGLYAAMRLLPIVPLIQESRATSDALGYFADKKMVKEEEKAYEILYPAFGSYIPSGVFGAAYDYISLDDGAMLITNIISIVTGHVVGRAKADEIEQKEAAGTTAMSRKRDPHLATDK
ncbi:hypothetical protein ACFL3Q_03370 [Planctomycetota bacterium]